MIIQTTNHCNFLYLWSWIHESNSNCQKNHLIIEFAERIAISQCRQKQFNCLWSFCLLSRCHYHLLRQSKSTSINSKFQSTRSKQTHRYSVSFRQRQDAKWYFEFAACFQRSTNCRRFNEIFIQEQIFEVSSRHWFHVIEKCCYLIFFF